MKPSTAAPAPAPAPVAPAPAATAAAVCNYQAVQSTDYLTQPTNGPCSAV